MDVNKLADHCAYLYNEINENEEKSKLFLEEIKAALIEGKSSAFVIMMVLNQLGELRSNCDECG
jgi:hypothetical protein